MGESTYLFWIMHPTVILGALSKGEPDRELFWVKQNCWKCSVLLPLIRIPRVNTEHGQFAIHIISIKRGPRNNYDYVKKIGKYIAESPQKISNVLLDLIAFYQLYYRVNIYI